MEITDEWQSIPDGDSKLIFARKRMGWGAFDVRCGLCQSEADTVRGPRGDGQVRTIRYACSNDTCDGSGYANKTRTSNPEMSITGDLEVRIHDPHPWTITREIPHPIKCDYCGHEGSPPAEEYPYADDGYEPAEGYQSIFELRDIPEHLSRNHTELLACPRCGRYGTQNMFKGEFKHPADDDEYADEDEINRVARRTGETLRPLDRVTWSRGENGDNGDLYIVLVRMFNSRYATYDAPAGDYKLAKFEDLRSASFGFPSLMPPRSAEQITYRSIERSVPIYVADEEDLTFVHRGPLSRN